MARSVLRLKGEKWSCAIKMKPEMVLAFSLVFSFFSESNPDSPSLILIPSCPFPAPGLTLVCPHTLNIAWPTKRSDDPVCGGRARFTQRTRSGHL